MVHAVDEDEIAILKVFDLFTGFGYDLLYVETVRICFMHLLSSIFDDEVTIVT
jgi:hypothetical protein